VPLLVREFVLYLITLFLSIDFVGVADIILAMAPPGGNPLLKGLVASRPSAGQKSVDKGKGPRVVEPSQVKETPSTMKPISVIRPLSQSNPPAHTAPRPKKRKDREHKKDKSSRQSPTRLRMPTTFGDRAVAMDFLKYDLMVSNRVSVQLDNYEAGPYSAKTTPSDLYTAFLELVTRALLVGRIMGDELMKKDGENVEKLKADLENSASSLKFALSANIELVGRNKDLKQQLVQAKAEIGMLQERCSVAKMKEEQSNKRATDLRGKVEELEEEVASLKACRDEDGRLMAQLDQQLAELQDHVIEQHDKGFELAVQQAAFFYKIPTDDRNFDNRKAFFNDKLLPLCEIPDSGEQDELAEGGGEGGERQPGWSKRLPLD